MDRLGADSSREIIILGDGAHWIWEWAAKYPKAIPILDYPHLKEHVWDAAKVLHGEGTVAAAVWVDKIVARLWRGWVPSTVEMLHRMKPRGAAAADKRKAVADLVTYLENHEGMIAYSHHRAQGRHIGSGAIESFCKQLFTMRMKGPGMFWSEEGADHLMALRTLYLTGRWGQVFERGALEACRAYA